MSELLLPLVYKAVAQVRERSPLPLLCPSLHMAVWRAASGIMKVGKMAMCFMSCNTLQSRPYAYLTGAGAWGCPSWQE